MEETTQLALIPDEPLTLTSGFVTLVDLDHEEVPDPPKSLEDSIRRFGLLQPILVRLTYAEEIDGEGVPYDEARYDIVDGRRRLAACRKAGIEPMPCLFAETNLAIADVATLATNATRSPNPVAEFKAIERLTKQGATIKDISGATGMSQQTIKARRNLLRLHPIVLAAFEQGKVPASIAEDVAKLAPAVQEQAAKVVEEGGKLTGPVVKGLKLARTQAALHSMEALFDDVEMDAGMVPQGDAPIESRLSVELQSIIERMPSEQQVLIRSLEWVSAILTDIGNGQIEGTVTVNDIPLDAPLPPGLPVDEEPPDPYDQSDIPMKHELADDEKGSFFREWPEELR